MGRNIRNAVFTRDDTTAGYTVAASTITTTMVTPAVGARVIRWGLHSSAIGVGNDTVTATLLEKGDANTAANRLAQLTFVPDLTTANLSFANYGPGLRLGSGVETKTEGKLLNIDFAKAGAADSFVTMSTSFTTWVLWSL